MKTCKKNTFEVLDSYFLNTGNGKMNEGYFLENIFTQIDVTYRSDRHKRDYVKRAKVQNIIWTAFIDMTNEFLKYQDYGTVCTNQQLKAWLEQYGKSYEIFNPLYEEVERIKAEMMEG